MGSKASTKALTPARARQILEAASKTRVLVIGDVMLDHFIRGDVSRISPEAPVPVVEFRKEDFMPGGAANVARNLVALNGAAEIFGAVGNDSAAMQLEMLLRKQRIACEGLVADPDRSTSIKTRVIAHKQQVVRIDRETQIDLNPQLAGRLLDALKSRLENGNAVIIGDYGKGVVTQWLLDGIKKLCHERGVWLSFDPKPIHRLDLGGLSLITPNRKEAFELAELPDKRSDLDPRMDRDLMLVAERLLKEFKPEVLLITLGEQGMLLCQPGQKPFHIPTIAKDVSDVSGAGDTVIATFTLAMAAGATPIEAAILSNHAAGIVVGKAGTAVTSPEELLKSLR